MNTTFDSRTWPAWAWMIVILQVATLLLVMVPWLFMMGTMMPGNMMMFGVHATATPHPTASPH